MSSPATRFAEDVALLTLAERLAILRTANSDRLAAAISGLAEALGRTIGGAGLGPDGTEEILSSVIDQLYDAAAAESAAQLEANRHAH